MNSCFDEGDSYILLTGGTGFFGRSIIRFLEGSHAATGNIKVCLMSRNPETFIKAHPEFKGLSWLELHKGDILEPSTFPEGVEYTHILHAATDSTLGPELEPLERYNQIVDGTRNLLNFAVEKKVPRFLLTSSGGVYGQQPLEMKEISEEYCGMPDPTMPNNVYGVAKRCAEHLCALYQQKFGIQIVIARCFAFVGRDLPLEVHFAIGNFIRDALWRHEIVVNGDGESVRSYMDQHDLAEWLITLLYRGRGGCSYNVGSNQPIKIKDLACLVRDIVSPNKEVRIIGSPLLNGKSSIYIPDISRAKAEMNLKVTVPLADAIFKASEAHR